ncbi:MAG TPA: hypothetical protein VK633_10500, partial [Verrucomicrobiae bacterium]|nr:hypothetical protein [Verrucomicrobiae bacterium]
MQASARILFALILFALAGEGLGQPGFPAPAETNSAGTNAAPNNRRRFNRRTNELAGATNPAPAFPSFPTPAALPPRRLPSTNITGVAVDATNSVLVTSPAATIVTQTNSLPSNNTVAAQPAFPSAPVAATQPAVSIPSAGTPVPVPGTDRMAVPIPGSQPAVAAEALPSTNTLANSMPAPVNPALSADEVIPGGTIVLQALPVEQ